MGSELAVRPPYLRDPTVNILRLTEHNTQSLSSNSTTTSACNVARFPGATAQTAIELHLTPPSTCHIGSGRENDEEGIFNTETPHWMVRPIEAVNDRFSDPQYALDISGAPCRDPTLCCLLRSLHIG